MPRFRSLFFSMFMVIFSTSIVAAPVEKYLPSDSQYDVNIAKPSAVLGFEIGERHARHDQLVNYFSALSQSSNRVEIKEIGRTNELRQQILVTISSEKNLENLDDILEKRNFVVNNPKQDPLVIWLGYSIHGDEISGAHAAMVVAYYLAASKSEELSQLLENTIIVMEPSMNPDGMDRFVNWVNTYRGPTANDDPNHIEHHQQWRTGRTNHFGFDLNRDWLLLSQKESQNRLPYFYQYKPNVLGDFHEMGANSSYFFQPGIPSRTNPLTPKENIRLTEVLATFHAKALDKENRLYFSQEKYDDFYYGKGSTYPDINGAIGILYEQASSRGFQQDTINGLLTFEYGIKNHVLTSLSTIKGAWENRNTLIEYRQKFYQQANKLAEKEDFTGYLISEEKDSYRLNQFLSKLAQHQIKVYPLESDFRLHSHLYDQAHSYYIPLEQPQYHLVKALFSTDKNFKDNTFYDVSGWTLPLAMNIKFEQVERTWGLKLSAKPWQKEESATPDISLDAYAYAFEWHHFLAPKLLNELLANGIKVRVATKTFSSKKGDTTRQFSLGTIVIPAGVQTEKNWQQILQKSSHKTQIEVFSIASGYTVEGIDIGSGSLKPISPIKVLLVGGKGVSQYEAAEVLYYLDQQLNIPVTVVEKARLTRIDLADYSHIIFVDGKYSDISDDTLTKFESWGKNGGVLIAQKRAAKWLSEKGTLKVSFISDSQINQMFDTANLTYQDKESLAARKRIAGAIFATKLDTSHPLAYGYSEQSLPMFRNSTLIMNSPSQPFLTIAKYQKNPLLSGYTDKNFVNSIANNAALVGHNLGEGKVIATTDNLTFRGYWHGSAKLLANSLFFADAFSAPVND